MKGFAVAKGRLSPVLSPSDRQRLARWMATGVIGAAATLDVFVACDDDDVRTWATEHGVGVMWGPELGLNGAVDDGVDRLAEAGYQHVTIAHSDLPRPDHLDHITRPNTITLVPDRRRDGTNVMSFPIDRRVSASYGPHSFRRHEASARALGDVTVEVRADPDLSLDIDTPHDLTHPLIREVLPTWLRTNLANHR